MAIVNLILYRSNLWILQINYSLNALLKFSPPPMYTRTDNSKCPGPKLTATQCQSNVLPTSSKNFLFGS